MRATRRLLLLLALCGCQAPPEPPPPRPQLPASWVATLPCADCAGIVTTLTLWPDSVFYLERLRLENSEDDQVPDYLLGRWELSDGGRLRLASSEPLPDWQAGPEMLSLRKLNRGPTTYDDSTAATLVLHKELEPLEPRTQLAGFLDHELETLSIRECFSGRRFSVIPGGDSPALDRAWHVLEAHSSGPRLAMISARLGQAASPGGESRFVLYIDRFMSLEEDEDCPGGEE
ncbi:MAG: copper resistance protein NlpE N-terminal domain-containing protein [Calditrichaeota bacterium]|nr:copper resistance protein NlpE N-terminal domain-containing protein [Calditrichota bacterium]